MKLLTFVPNGDPGRLKRLGALLPGTENVVDLQAGALFMRGKTSPNLSGMLEFIEGGQEALESALEILQHVSRQGGPGLLFCPGDITVLAPIPRPGSIRDCLVFEKHLVQSTRAVVKTRFPLLAAIDKGLEKTLGKGFIKASKVWHDRPLYYKGNPFTVVGHEAAVHWPDYTGKLDYELEIGIYIGRMGRDIPVERAREYIGGYTVFNDFSARDIQIPEMMGRLGPAKSKDFDTGNSMGPYLVTPDELPDPYSLTMVARVNGEEWSRGSSRDMRHSFEDIISYISRGETLYPGEFIGSGTVGGGCGLELDRWLKPGDVVELEVEGLGILRNHIVKD